jgi:hypothetical protein
MEIIQLMVEVKRRSVAACTLAFAEEDVFSARFGGFRLRSVQTACRGVKLGRRRKIEHVLRLRHVTCANPVKNDRPYLEGRIGSPLKYAVRCPNSVKSSTERGLRFDP